jgi:hypothetical protein
MLFGGGAPAEEWITPDWVNREARAGRNTRYQYHKGGSIWDSDRYGPALPLVAELHRRIEDARLKAHSAR